MQQKNAAGEKCCNHRNEAEAKTYKHTKQMQKKNAANIKEHTKPQNNCKREMLQIHSTKRKCARPLGGLDQWDGPVLWDY